MAGSAWPSLANAGNASPMTVTGWLSGRPDTTVVWLSAVTDLESSPPTNRAMPTPSTSTRPKAAQM